MTSWRVDIVERSGSGSVLQVMKGEPVMAYDTACTIFDKAFGESDSFQSVRLMRARYDHVKMTLEWITMREAWAGST